MFHLFVINMIISTVIGFLSVEKTRNISYEGVDFTTTFSPDKMFIGKYQGKKSGYLLLKEDGTGEYQYEIFGFAPESCQPGIITFEWGFLLNQNNEIIRNERDYGYSCPFYINVLETYPFRGVPKKYFLIIFSFTKTENFTSHPQTTG